MKVIHARHTIKLQLTRAQEQQLRKELNCVDRPIQYAGAIMYSQCGGWYEISANPTEYDWASEIQMRKGLLRKIISVLSPAVVERPRAERIVQPVAYVDPAFRPVAKSETQVDPRRLQHLAASLNSRFHVR